MASLLLSDGTSFSGEPFGATKDTDGEVVFNTGMAGYPESMTDPSYRGQILVFTYPLIGNYGVPSEELNQWGFSKNFESEQIHVRGIVVTQVSETYSHHAAVSSLQNWMEHHGIPGITGVDTRTLTKKLREEGVMLGRIVRDAELKIDPPPPRLRGAGNGKLKIDDPNTRNLVAEVSCSEVHQYEPKGGSVATVIAYDCGMKRNILRSFLKRNVTVVRVPWDFDLASYSEPYDAVFISNGPGDPETCTETIHNIHYAIEKFVPTFGICLGNQLMALAVGAKTFKLKYGHRGVNQPCVEVFDGDADEKKVISGKRLAGSNDPGEDSFSANRKPLTTNHCIITSQNHGFAVDADSLPNEWDVWFTNANDGTVEGIRHESGRFFAVQFHPEASPGPEDANYLFDEFLSVVRASKGN